MRPENKLMFLLSAIGIGVVLVVAGWIYLWIYITDPILNHDLRKFVQFLGILPPVVVTAWILVRKGIIEP